MSSEEEIEKLREVITERFENDLKDIVEPFKSEYIRDREKIIELTVLVYRDGIQLFPPNFTMSIIHEILNK